MGPAFNLQPPTSNPPRGGGARPGSRPAWSGRCRGRRSCATCSTREAFRRALVPYLRRERELLRDSGVDVVQFDDPHICLFVDPKVRAEHADPEREVAMAVDMLNEIVEGVGGVTVGIHLCR